MASSFRANADGTTSVLNGSGTEVVKFPSTASTNTEVITLGSSQIAKAWVNFNAIPLSGTYSQTGTVITVTMTAHGMSTGMIANLDFTSGTATDGTDFVVTVTDANTFTVVGKTSVTTSGNVTRNNYIRSAFNVSSVTDNGVGNYTMNFTTAMLDTNYSYSISSGVSSSPTASSTRSFCGGATNTNNFNFLVSDNNADNNWDVEVACVQIFK